MPDEARSTVTPYLFVAGAARLIRFLEEAFGARERGRLQRPDGSLMHAELVIGDSLVMIGEPMGELAAMPAMIYLTVDDCDAAYRAALDAGAVSIMEVTDMHHAGERYGGVQDPLGNIWWVGTTVEHVSWEEQARRVEALTRQEPPAE